MFFKVPFLSSYLSPLIVTPDEISEWENTEIVPFAFSSKIILPFVIEVNEVSRASIIAVIPRLDRRDELDIRKSMVGSAARCAVENEIFISAHHALCDRRPHIRIVLFAGQDDNIPPVRSVSEGIEIAYN